MRQLHEEYGKCSNMLDAYYYYWLYENNLSFNTLECLLRANDQRVLSQTHNLPITFQASYILHRRKHRHMGVMQFNHYLISQTI
jgi:hypothetical protein